MNLEATIQILNDANDWVEMDDSRFTFTNGIDEAGRNVAQILADVAADATRPVRIVTFDAEAEIATDQVLAS